MSKQKGMTFISFIMVAVFVGAVAITFFKVVPAYTQYFSIKGTVTKVAKESGGMTPAAIRESFDKHAQIAYITDVSSKDLKIAQVGGITRVSASYEKVVPLVANISLLFEFDIDASSGGAKE